MLLFALLICWQQLLELIDGRLKLCVDDDIHTYICAGLFMALQPRIIACGNTIAAFAMGVRFITGPAVMAVASIAVGLRGVLLHIAIVQVYI